MHVSQLGEMVEEAQEVNDQKLSELEEKFEVICLIYHELFFCINDKHVCFKHHTQMSISFVGMCYD